MSVGVIKWVHQIPAGGYPDPDIDAEHINSQINDSVGSASSVGIKLCMEGSGWEFFACCVLQRLIYNTRIAELDLTLVQVWDINFAGLTTYLAGNTALKSIKLSIRDVQELYLCRVLQRLSEKVNLKKLEIFVQEIFPADILFTNGEIRTHTGEERKFEHEIICNLVNPSSPLNYLSVNLPIQWPLPNRWRNPARPVPRDVVNFIELCQNLASNTTLTHFDMVVYNQYFENDLLDCIDQNTTLLELNLCDLSQQIYPTSIRDSSLSKDKLNKFLERNHALIWRNVHRTLLNLTLIFNEFPAYIILEIFDWLPHMNRVKHGPKIKLIISTLKSIKSVRKT